MKRRYASLLIVIGAILYSGSVFAADPNGPTWDVIGMGAIGLLISWVGWYTKGVSDRVSKVEARVNELNTVMLREYHPKADITLLLNDIKDRLNKLHDRFEKFEQIYGR